MMEPSTTDAAPVCAVAGRCGGCPLLGEAEARQRALRLSRFREALPEWASSPARLVRPSSSLRDRVDLQLRDGVLGMLGPGAGGPSDFIPIPDCPAASPPVRSFLADLLSDPPPLQRASLRLRVAPDGRRGLWIDADRQALEAFATEGAPWLRRWLDPERAGGQAVIEAGQRLRAFELDAHGAPALTRPRRHAWSHTFIGGQALPLQTRVADFTQPSVSGNGRLLAEVMRLCAETGQDAWLELGAGAGNMTLPLLAKGWTVRAVELQTEALAHNLALAEAASRRSGPAALRGLRGASARCALRAGSLDSARDVAGWVLGAPAVLADPPRSGLGAFVEGLNTLSPSLRPKVIVYVSCWLDALKRDAPRLAVAGYRLERAVGVEQFRDAPEVEWVTLWRRAETPS